MTNPGNSRVQSELEKDLSDMGKFLEERLEPTIARGRWLLVPYFLLLLVAVFIMTFRSFGEILALAKAVQESFASGVEENEVTIRALELVDTTLVAGLILIVSFAGYNGFVSKVDKGLFSNASHWPLWLQDINFADLKLKLMSAIVAISGVELLKAFLQLERGEDFVALAWRVGIHLTFAVSVLLFTISDRLGEKKSK